MKITHLSNSFIIVDFPNFKLCCDPWVGKANYGGWHSFPEFKTQDITKLVSDVDYVYISHIHDDHLDVDFLKKSNLIDKTFLIKNFEFKILYNRLLSIGVKKIIELNAYEIFNFNAYKLSILPQLSSNSSDIDEDVEYDLDTSLVISDGKYVFFNQVDNPYSIDDYKEIYQWIKLNYGEITVAALMAGAASEYPHTFLNIDREKEKQKVIQNSLSHLVEKINVLKPLFYFPAGGTYIIPGKFHLLNKFIAQPSFIEIQNLINESDINVKPIFLEGGKSIFLNDNEFKIESNILPISDIKEFSIRDHIFDLYDYETESISINFNILQDIFNAAKLNWEKAILEKNIQIEQDVKFIVESNLMLSESLSEVKNNQVGVLELQSNLTKKKGDLTIHIDIRAMYLCLIKKKVWNGTIGSLCLFERLPNEFYPSVTFSLNYLVIDNTQKKLFGL